MNVAAPYTAVVPTVDGDVLVTLAGTSRPLTGREIERLVDRSHNAVQRTLDRLVEHGLVTRHEAGRAFLHTLNREHLAAPAVEMLAGLARELRTRVTTLISEWRIEPEHASLFGSAARADGTTKSDIDLFLVRDFRTDAEDPAWRDQIDDLETRVLAWTGNHAEVHDVRVDELPRLLDASAPILNELRDHAVDLYGTRLYELLKEAGGP